MPVEPVAIERLAELAGLHLDSESLEGLSGEISSILEFVSRIGCTDEGVELRVPAGPTGDAATRLREDESTHVRPIPNPWAFAPEFEDGFFLVPRPESLGEG